MNTQTKIEAPPNVYQCIASVQAALAKHGIGKDSENTFDRYKFRGVDAVYNALAPLLAQYGLNILPRIIDRQCAERVSKKGDPMFYVTVTAEFDLVSAADGSTHTVRTFGEAMDRSDKATNKAMAAAYKYMAFLTFAIPTEGDNDADASTPEVASTEMPDTEWAKLCNLIKATSSNTGKMCEHWEVKDLRQLNQQQYAEALDMLNTKLAKMAKDETANLAKELEDEIQF